jgi:glyoxylase-like metal-dependent hydrolase (beta-lactamase superfamily II)
VAFESDLWNPGLPAISPDLTEWSRALYRTLVAHAPTVTTIVPGHGGIAAARVREPEGGTIKPA